MKPTTDARPVAPDSTPSHPGMAWIAGATFLMGSDKHYPEEAPAHRARVDGFWMDTHTVTNREFKRFVEATGYVTVAERPADAADYPGADPAMLLPASVVFVKAPRALDTSDHYQWWRYVQGADWRHPNGPGSSLQGLWEHPVVQVAFEDAEAYARWVNKALPTEAEWELAARGGLDGAEFVWGDELTPGGKAMANTWQGEFPWQNLLDDGFEATAPVGTFPPNGHGLYDMAGNVWQWTTDWFQDHGRIKKACCTIDNPRGGRERRELRRAHTRCANPSQGHQGRLFHLRAELLPALSTCGANGAGGEFRDLPHRLPLHRPAGRRLTWRALVHRRCPADRARDQRHCGRRRRRGRRAGHRRVVARDDHAHCDPRREACFVAGFLALVDRRPDVSACSRRRRNRDCADLGRPGQICRHRRDPHVAFVVPRSRHRRGERAPTR